MDAARAKPPDNWLQATPDSALLFSPAHWPRVAEPRRWANPHREDCGLRAGGLSARVSMA